MLWFTATFLIFAVHMVDSFSDFFSLFTQKMQEPEKEILGYKEKIEFYRSKMQELVSHFLLWNFDFIFFWMQYIY